MSLAYYHQLQNQSDPIEVVVVGLGFMSFGFLSQTKNSSGIRVAVVISRRPEKARAFLEKEGYQATIESNPGKIKDLAKRGVIAVSDDLDLIATYDNKVVMEMTGTVTYGTDVALRTATAGKHLITMNPELQATVGSQLKPLFDKQNLIISDVIGDQPGSLARLIASAKLKGFRPILAGNMKRYMDLHATQEKMQPWADDKGLSVNQTVSFTDGTKQSIEMNLVSNYFGMTILQPGMAGPVVEKFDDALDSFDWDAVPKQGVVDYMIGMSLFPGVFIVAEHDDPHQQKYLRYLNMGEGPRYVLFDPYHLCHLEVSETIANAVFHGLPTINNGLAPTTITATFAKKDLQAGEKLDSIGGDSVYGSIRVFDSADEFLPVGIARGCVLKRNISQDQPIKISDVTIPPNAATQLLGLG